MTEGFNSEIKQGLSDYSRKLAADTQNMLKSYSFASNEDGAELSEIELAFEEINKDFINTCLVSILADMSLDERKAFNEQSLDIAHLVRMAMDKLNLSEGEKKIVEIELKKINPENIRLPSELLAELNLLNDDSPLSVLKKTIYDSLQDKPEVAEAYSYLNLTS